MRAKSRTFSFLPRRFAEDQRGGAAIEFAIILPVMMALTFSGAEFCNAVAVEKKLTTTARTISDIASQDTAISDAEMTTILEAGKVLLQPYPASDLKLRISAIKIDANKQATVEWSDAYPAGDARGKGSSVTVPEALLVPNTQLIWGEVAYDYTPVVAIIKNFWSFKYENNHMYARPRESSGVCRPACS